MHKRTKNMAGLKFGRLSVVEFHGYVNKKAKWLCKCECGKEILCFASSLKAGYTKSCGCLLRGMIPHNKRKYSRHPLHYIFQCMKQRCYNKNNPAYKFYGGRNVIICDEWLKNPDSFVEWAISNGWEIGLEIDKDIKSTQLNITPIYSPDTCSVVTSKQNGNSKKSNVILEYMGQKKTVSQWAEDVKICVGTLWDRIFVLKWSVDEALTISNTQNTRKKNKINEQNNRKANKPIG